MFEFIMALIESLNVENDVQMIVSIVSDDIDGIRSIMKESSVFHTAIKSSSSTTLGLKAGVPNPHSPLFIDARWISLVATS